MGSNMSDGKFQHKRGAPGDKGGHNPVNTRPPQEHLVIIGGPTNTFNAWWSYVTLRPGVVNRSRYEGFWAAQPKPRTMREIDYYLGVSPRDIDPVKSLDPQEWQRKGWSNSALKDLRLRNWLPSDVQSVGPETHDRYWANFIDAAVRLYSQSTPLAAPLRRPTLAKGDIVTFMVYAPAYEARQRIDWAASPYNRIHLQKQGIKGNPLYDPGARGIGAPIDLKQHYPGLDKPPTLTGHDKRNQEKLRKDQEEARRTYQDQPLSETDINHYILMRTTSENSGKHIKRPPNNYCYFDYIEDTLRNAVPRNDVMTKVLFFGHPSQVVHYVGNGTWVGEHRRGMVSESQMEAMAKEEDARQAEIEEKSEHLEDIYHVDMRSRYGLHNYFFSPPRPQTQDIYGRPLQWKLYWNRQWDSAPAVDRNRVKIVRLDYFGHSATDTMMLDWGWVNDKGDLPGLSEIHTTKELLELKPSDFEMVLPGIVAQNAFATLWGCHMGNDFGPRLADFFGEGVVAAENSTDFEKLIHNDANMPVPADGEPWYRYMPAPKSSPAGTR